jgi:glycosyltransferase involved in cell wall biosynthesis
MGKHPQRSQESVDRKSELAGLTLSVIIPALNEEHGIAEILEQVLSVRDSLSQVGVEALEVIVVDDGSVDETARIAAETPRVRLIRHPVNRGYGAAIKTGFRAATGELLAFLDADSTYPPSCLPELCDAVIREEADIAIGSRRSGADTGMPLIRRIGNLFWSLLLSWIGNEKIQDPASGMRVLRRQCLPQLYPLPDGLNFTPVMSTRSVHEGLKVLEIPIPYRERTGRSKLSVVRDGIRFLWTIVWTALQYNPARILESTGFGALAAAGIIGMLLVIARLKGVTELGAWGVFAVFTSMVLAVGGVSVFLLGISFNYLVAILHRRRISQRTLMEHIFGSSPERDFGWLGLAIGAGGAALGVVSLFLGLRGWEITRFWLWQLGSAMFLLVGAQIILFWLLIRVMATLSCREDSIRTDLTGKLEEAPAGVSSLAHAGIAGGLPED